MRFADLLILGAILQLGCGDDDRSIFPADDSVVEEREQTPDQRAFVDRRVRPTDSAWKEVEPPEPAPPPRDGFTATRYPIVLAHGLMGFESIGNLLDYWYDIPGALESDGAIVYITEVSVVHASTERGEQLLEQIEDVLAVSGAKKVNIIGHSQGTLDARYVASMRPEIVASVTSIAGPHGGVPGLLGLLESDVFRFGAWAVGGLIQLLAGTDNPTDAMALAHALSPDGMRAFNAAFPEAVPEERCGEGQHIVNGVRYYSWSGTEPSTNTWDVFDVPFGILGEFGDEENDGLVGRCSSHLGRVIRDDYRHNHLDEVNLMWGLVPGYEQDPKQLIRNQANRLKNAGL